MQTDAHTGIQMNTPILNNELTDTHTNKQKHTHKEIRNYTNKEANARRHNTNDKHTNEQRHRKLPNKHVGLLYESLRWKPG